MEYEESYATNTEDKTNDTLFFYGHSHAKSKVIVWAELILAYHSSLNPSKDAFVFNNKENVSTIVPDQHQVHPHWLDLHLFRAAFPLAVVQGKTQKSG